MNVIFISQCQKKALHRTRKVLDAYANRIGDNAWQTSITEEGLEMVQKLLRQTASKNTAVSCHKIKTRNRTELEWIVGNKLKFNELGYTPVNFTSKELIMDKLPIETNTIFANTHGQPLSQHLFAVGYLAYQLVLKFNINHTNLAQSAFIAGILHDIGKLDPKFQEWASKKINKKSDDELDNIILPDDGVHINGSDSGFAKFSFEKYPRHHEISWLLANALLRDKNGLNNNQLTQIYHAIYWHHTRPYRKKEDEKYFENARGIDKKWQEYADIKLVCQNLIAIFKDIKTILAKFNQDNDELSLPNFNFDYELSCGDIPLYKIYDNLADKAVEITKDIAFNAQNSIVRMAVITADRMVSKMSAEDLSEYLAEGSLIHALDNEFYSENTLLKNNISGCLKTFADKYPNSERNQKQTVASQQLKQVGEYTGFDKDYIAVLQGPAGCGKTKIALEWALNTDAKKIIWICPRVQVCLGILQDLTQADYLKNCQIEIFTGEYKKILSNGQSFDEVENTEPEQYFSGDVVITTIDQVANHIISHQKITGMSHFMQSHIVFDEFHELMVQPALNLLFAELIECKKLQHQFARTLLISATPNYYFINQVLNLQGKYLVKMDSFNTADYRIEFQTYDDKNECNPLLTYQADKNQTTFVISNTALNAQLGFLLNQNKENGILLHSKYTRQDKADLFNQVFECFKQNGNRQYQILRSGPIVQASLNISCERMLTDMTSSENWLQRLGRLDRFNQNHALNIYTTVLPVSAQNGKQSSGMAKFLNNMNVWQNSLAWLQFLQSRLVDKESIQINELYEIYQAFYDDEKHHKMLEQDLNQALKESVKLINDKVSDPISTPVRKNQKSSIMKMAKTSLRGDNCFVQMAVCEVDSELKPTFVEEYAYPEETDHSQITVGLTESVNRIQGGRDKYRNEDKNLVAFMRQKHHNIKLESHQADRNWRKYNNNDKSYLGLARSPENPIYLSYTPSDLELIGGERERHDYAMYYIKLSKLPVGIIAIDKLINPQKPNNDEDEEDNG